MRYVDLPYAEIPSLEDFREHFRELLGDMPGQDPAMADDPEAFAAFVEEMVEQGDAPESYLDLI